MLNFKTFFFFQIKLVHAKRTFNQLIMLSHRAKHYHNVRTRSPLIPSLKRPKCDDVLKQNTNIKTKTILPTTTQTSTTPPPSPPPPTTTSPIDTTRSSTTTTTIPPPTTTIENNGIQVDFKYKTTIDRLCSPIPNNEQNIDASKIAEYVYFSFVCLASIEEIEEINKMFETRRKNNIELNKSKLTKDQHIVNDDDLTSIPNINFKVF